MIFSENAAKYMDMLTTMTGEHPDEKISESEEFIFIQIMVMFQKDMFFRSILVGFVNLFNCATLGHLPALKALATKLLKVTEEMQAEYPIPDEAVVNPEDIIGSTDPSKLH